MFLGDADHAAFDNLAFADHCTLLVTEDRGDTLHDQLNTLDSVWAFRVCLATTTSPSVGAAPADRAWARFFRPASPLAGAAKHNEPTGLHAPTAT